MRRRLRRWTANCAPVAAANITNATQPASRSTAAIAVSSNTASTTKTATIGPGAVCAADPGDQRAQARAGHHRARGEQRALAASPGPRHVGDRGHPGADRRADRDPGEQAGHDEGGHRCALRPSRSAATPLTSSDISSPTM
jgi:hypothetical protein